MDIRNYFSAPNTTKKLEKKTSAEKPSKDTAIKKKKPKRRIPDSDDELSDPNKASKSNTSTPSRQSTRLVQKKIKVKDEPKVKVEDKVEVKPKRKSKVKDEPKSASESEEIANKKSVRSIRSKTTKSNSNEVDDDEISPYNSTSENLEIFSSPRSSTRKSTLVEGKTPETTPKKRQSFEANISDDDDFPPEEEALPTKKTKHEQKNVEEKSPSKRVIKSPRSKKGKPHDVDNDDDEMNIAETTDQIKNKTGPTASESKEIPQGEDMCLFGKTFVFTGDLDTLDREEAQDIVKRNGGRVTLQPSSRTSYVVVGKDPGPKKMEKVEQFKIPTLNEEQLLELIRTSPKKSSSNVASIKKSPKSKAPITKISEAIASVTSTDANGTQLWTEKYRPKHLRDFCGNQNLVKDMIKWLSGWNEKSFKFKSKEWMPALLISGPPGIGKTSSVHLIAGLEGYEVIELNASDTRSKKSLEAAIKVAIKNTSITGFFYPVNDKTSGKAKAKDVQKKRTLILMDELDGMSSGDRGGIAELIQLIKKTRIPIVCVCNDINSQKFKSLKTYCHEARFSKPRVEQIRSRIMTIATRENLEIRPTDVDELIRGSNSDIRQILNILSSWKINHDSIDYDEIKALNKTNEKHLRKSLFEISKDFLSNDIWKSRKNTFNDKMKLYFQEHDLIPLMIFENYIKMKPHTITKFIKKHDNEDIKPDVLEKLASLEAFAKAADSMSYGDMVDKRIRGPRQEWNLMPMHGYFSTIAPAYYVHGFNKGGQFGQYKFPSWLGQNSKAQKIQRQLKEIQSHIRTKVSADRGEIRESYIPTLRKALIKPLVVNKADGMIDVINFMDQYMITKEQFDTIMEFKDEQTRYNGSDIPSTTKASFTRKYNATSHPLPFLNVSNVVTTKVNKPVITADLDDFVIEEVVPDDDDVVEDEDDLTKDRLIKQPSAGRGGGRGGGRGSRGSRGASRGTSRGGSRGGRGSRGSRKERK